LAGSAKNSNTRAGGASIETVLVIELRIIACMRPQPLKFDVRQRSAIENTRLAALVNFHAASTLPKSPAKHRRHNFGIVNSGRQATCSLSGRLSYCRRTIFDVRRASHF
jgi:hypothetical protein